MPHSSTTALLRYFEYSHLPPRLQEVSREFSTLAAFIQQLPPGSETIMAMRKLLESKDCAVRAALDIERQVQGVCGETPDGAQGALFE